jgi:predicted hotdog family 3-hydroxylacyl-ACP dehydratase
VKKFGREDIMRMIPHAGEMCLLDEILDWDADFLRCRSGCAGRAENPLRRLDGSLGMACGIEIAGQAMAAHGWLTGDADKPPLAGMLVSVRDVELAGGLLNAAALMIEVERLMGDTNGASYRFSVSGDSGKLLGGRATVLIRGAE